MIIPRIEEILQNINENFILCNDQKDNIEDLEEKYKSYPEGKRKICNITIRSQ